MDANVNNTNECVFDTPNFLPNNLIVYAVGRS